MFPESSRIPLVVDTPQALDGMTARLKVASRVAVDTEGNSLYNYFQKICLIQLSFDESHVIVDPLAKMELGGFLRVLAQKPLILHAADNDLRMLRKSHNFAPAETVFDTMLAARILGHERLGLVTLLQEYLGVTHTKRGQKSNWSRRPLSPEQIEYALDDTRHLEALASALENRLRDTGRYEWHAQACRQLTEASRHDSERDRDEAWRIKGWSALEPHQQLYLRELWKWREREARRIDRPPFRVLGNQQLIEWAVWAEGHPHAPIEKGPPLPRNCRGGRLQALAAAINHARALPESAWPRRKPVKARPAFRPEIVTELQEACARVAAEVGAPDTVLAPRRALEAIARAQPRTLQKLRECEELMQWQLDILAPAILEVMNRGRGASTGNVK